MVTTDDGACVEAFKEWIHNPHRLMSLGEMMKAIRLTDIYNVGATIAAAVLHDAIEEGLKFHDFDRHGYLENLLRFKETCTALGLASTLHQVNRVEAILNEGIERNDGSAVLWGALQPEIRQMGIRLQEETEDVGGIIAYHLTPAERELYDDPTKDWQKALSGFPSTLNDVQEMGKCSALGRHTAAVFHAMRILEAGLRALAIEFNVKVSQSSWGGIIDKIRKAIDAKTEATKKANARWREQSFHSDAAIQMVFFKDAWRNHVMHARVTFDEQTAPPIIEYVRRFMNHLATNLAE